MTRPPDACSSLVTTAERLAGTHPTPRAFVRALARDGAGIRPGPWGLVDLARGGRNRLRGKGFRPVYDDGTAGQVRHFCGVARACYLLGVTPTRWLMERSGDDAGSADGQLTEVAIILVRELRSGRLSVGEVAEWIDHRICAPGRAGG